MSGGLEIASTAPALPKQRQSQLMMQNCRIISSRTTFPFVSFSHDSRVMMLQKENEAESGLGRRCVMSSAELWIILDFRSPSPSTSPTQCQSTDQCPTLFLTLPSSAPRCLQDRLILHSTTTTSFHGSLNAEIEGKEENVEIWKSENPKVKSAI
jgi:hypothetical protein